MLQDVAGDEGLVYARVFVRLEMLEGVRRYAFVLRSLCQGTQMVVSTATARGKTGCAPARLVGRELGVSTYLCSAASCSKWWRGVAETWMWRGRGDFYMLKCHGHAGAERCGGRGEIWCSGRLCIGVGNALWVADESSLWRHPVSAEPALWRLHVMSWLGLAHARPTPVPPCSTNLSLRRNLTCASRVNVSR